MPNQYFRFRRFTVWQDSTAMKVCTDACLFAAWVSAHLADPQMILDIGTGTGLLSLMLAQQTEARFDAVEIEKNAALQAAGNFRDSPWPERLNAILGSIQDFARTAAPASYDLIITNPPFLDNDLKSPDEKRNLALHDGALGLPELIACADRLLKPHGSMAIIIPAHRSALLDSLVENKGWSTAAKTRVRQTAQHTFFRMMYLFCKSPVPATVFSDITIKDDNHTYTPEFSALMKDYYLVPDNALR